MMTLRLLVNARSELEGLSMLARATATLEDTAEGHDGEIVLILDAAPRAHGSLDRAVRSDGRVRAISCSEPDDASRLDVGLFLRPLPVTVAVVGRSTRTVLPDMVPIYGLLLNAGIGAMTTGGDLGNEVRSFLEDGAVFGAGPLCVAGGFSGDPHRSVHERLDAVGFPAIELPASSIKDDPGYNTRPRLVS
jgi:hypothetical protein